MAARKRYGAFLILSLLFLLAFSINAFETPFSRNKDVIYGPTQLNPVQNVRFSEVPQTIVVPAPKKTIDEGVIPGFPIDVNRASVEELMLLPGIGEKTALRIIEKREEKGGFASIDELTEVKWVGKVKLDRIRGLIIVRPRQAAKKGGPHGGGHDREA